MALVLGMMVGGCSSGDDGDPFWNSLNDGVPPAGTLSQYGLTAAEFLEIKNATGGYQGWRIERDEWGILYKWHGKAGM